MKNIEKKLTYIEEKIESIINKAESLEVKYENTLKLVHPRYNKSAVNFVHYLALRSFNLEKLQEKIDDTGLQGLSHIEAHVMKSLLTVIKIASYLKGGHSEDKKKKAVTAVKSRKIINKNTRVLFGRKPSKRKTRIMVTIPSHASEDYDFIKTLIKAGMDCARINCAHDNSEVWKKMIDNIKRAEKEEDKKCTVMMDLSGPKIRTGVIRPALEDKAGPSKDFVKVREGERVVIYREDQRDEGAVSGSDGMFSPCAHISCTLPAIFKYTKSGDSVFFDDGKIEGIIEKAFPDRIVVRITAAKEKGSKLRSDKGINFPETDYKISGLTDKDREDICFVAEYADVVNLSFVNCREDVEALIDELEKYDSEAGIILKIETQSGFRNLPELLLTAMKRYPAGVMIARGDLAIETGWKNFAVIQEEIIRVCEAAHIPVVWATQVLENLAKKGIPTRSEITDAAMAHRCECVMLNKGPYILKAVKMLDRILRRMEIMQDKQEVLLPAMDGADDLMLSDKMLDI